MDLTKRSATLLIIACISAGCTGGCTSPGGYFRAENILWRVKVVSDQGEPIVGAILTPGDNKNPEMLDFREFTDTHGKAEIFIPYGGERAMTIFGVLGPEVYYPQVLRLHILAEGHPEMTIERPRSEFVEERPGLCLYLVRDETLTIPHLGAPAR